MPIIFILRKVNTRQIALESKGVFFVKIESVYNADNSPKCNYLYILVYILRNIPRSFKLTINITVVVVF